MLPEQLRYEPRRNDFDDCSCEFEAEVECTGCEEYNRAQSSYWREIDGLIDQERDRDGDRADWLRDEWKDQDIQERNK